MQASHTTALAPTQSQVFVFSAEQKELIKNTVAKGATDNELALFLHLAQTYGLDPFAKEIWCIKYRPTDAATIMTGRDGYLTIANRNEAMDGLVSDTVCENDELLKQVDGSVIVTYGRPRGAVIGAYALVYRNDRTRPVYAYAPLSEYKGNSPIWNKFPSAMILKVAESMALKRAFNISGLVTQEEIDMQPAVDMGTSATVVEESQQVEVTVEYASAEQLEEIIGLLNHHTITLQEKTKMMLNINRLDYDRAAQSIAKLRQAIKDRSVEVAQVVEQSPVVEAPTTEAKPKAPKIRADQHEELTALMSSPFIKKKDSRNLLLVIGKMTEERATKEIAKWKQFIADAEADQTKQHQQAVEQTEAEAQELDFAKSELYDFVDQHSDALPKGEYSRLNEMLYEEAVTAEQLRDALEAARILVKQPAPNVEAEAPSATPTASAASGASTDPHNKILHLLSNALILPHERTSKLKKVNSLTEEQAAQCVKDLEKLLIERQDPRVAVEHARKQLVDFANKFAAKLGEVEYNSLMKRSKAATATAMDFSNEIMQAMELLQDIGVAA